MITLRVMAKKKDKGPGQDGDAEVLSAIQAFEQILEAMPNDRASLEALSHAYEQIGDLPKALEHTVRLGNVMLDEGDESSAQQLLGKLKDLAGDDPGAQELIAKIEPLGPCETATAPAAAGTKETTPERKPRPEVAASSTFNMADELSFAWALMEAGELTQEEYATVVQDLTEMSAGDSDATISVLHALEARGFKKLDKVIAYISKECETPIISLTCFDMPPEVSTLLPMDFMVRRGTLIFELMGSYALAVIMNPYDKALQKDVEDICGRTCHFFVTSPSEFDQAIDKLSAVEVEK